MFQLNNEQRSKLEEWKKEQDAKVVERRKQKRTEEGREATPTSRLEEKTKRPYAGPIGGSLTYMFTPTSMGTVLKVKHSITEEVIDLTDYDWW